MPTTTPASPRTSSAPGIVKRIADMPSLQLWLFAATLFSSALLLFAVQPMFAKMALPKLGGSSSVWAVSTCFFQATLLAGYCYAHVLNRVCAPRAAVGVHALVLTLAIFALPVALPTSLGEPPEGDAYLWLISVLALGVGVPFFAVSANAPLLQAWFSRTGHPDARDPYFLYGASNVGSLLALIAYPLLVETTIGAAMQTRLWSVGFLALGVLVAVCGLVMVTLSSSTHDRGSNDRTADEITPVSWHQRALWIALAALPSGLMVAVTTYITTDIASAPFLWVIPLALFLLTFILVFKERVSQHFPLVTYALPLTVLLAIVAPAYKMPLVLASFFMAALACHRQLFLDRPEPRHLTAFYLWMSFGGVIGGVFSALLAPQLFTSTREFDLLLVASMFCLPGVIFGVSERVSLTRVAMLAGLAVLAITARSMAGTVGSQAKLTALIFMGLAAIGVLVRSWPERRIAAVIGVALIAGSVRNDYRPIYAERSFYGTVRVLETHNGQHRIMLHGTTLHGMRRIHMPDGTPVATPVPASYFHAAAPLARGFDIARTFKTPEPDGAATTLKIGIVGLGPGSMACFRRPGDDVRFYEIDPSVVRVASNPAHFDFLERCAPDASLVIGDARLTLAKEPNKTFDYLVLDAFSSNNVPAHLITAEAIRLYAAKLSDNGLLALHVSNRYLDLGAAVASTLASVPGLHGVHARFAPAKTDLDAFASGVVLISKNVDVINAVRAWPDATPLVASTLQPWTDDHANILAAMLRLHWR